MTGPEVAAAVERAAAWMYAPAVRPEDLRAVLAQWQLDAAAGALGAALNGPADDEGMDDATMAAHIAICEDSPNECLEYRGPCVKAIEAARTALIGEDS